MDSGFKVSKDGVDVTTASNADLLLNLGYPQAKLDTTVSSSFQNINLLFTSNPPGGVSTVTTLVYRIEHGYTYIPSNWVLFQEVTPPAGALFYQNYFQDSGIVCSLGAFSQATLYAKADNTYINFYVDKFDITGVSDCNLIGALFKIRSYVFVNDVGV